MAKSKNEQMPASLDALGALVGYKMVTDPRTISKVTGTEHLFHGTTKDRISSILENGLLVSKSYDPETVSFKHGLDDVAKGYVFTGRTMKPVNKMNAIQHFTRLMENKDFAREFKNASYPKKLYMFFKGKLGTHKSTSTLKIRIPYDKLRELGSGVDPGWIRDKEHTSGPVSRFLNGLLDRAFSPGHTMTFTSDISPEYIKGSRQFNHGIKKELSGITAYAKKHPGRFLRGAGAMGLGSSLVGYSLYDLYRKINKKETIKDKIMRLVENK